MEENIARLLGGKKSAMEERINRNYEERSKKFRLKSEESSTEIEVDTRNSTEKSQSKVSGPEGNSDDALRRGYNRRRHLTCLTSYKPIKESRHWKELSKQREEEIRLTVNKKITKQMWENYVLSQVSSDTVKFVASRFDENGETKDFPDFCSQTYADADRQDILHRRRNRLFDLWYVDMSEPGLKTHL